MFGQRFDYQDIAIVGLLIVLEGVLSIDNALVLGLLARRLPRPQQPRALTYGLLGAFVFRLIAITTASLLLKWLIAKLLGGLYLLYVSFKYFIFESHHDKPHGAKAIGGGRPTAADQGSEAEEADGASSPEDAGPVQPAPQQVQPDRRYPLFWPTVAVIELTDIAFAVDSILAAVGLVADESASGSPGGPHPKLWVIITGGMLGVVLMRFAAVLFIRLLERFPRFETAAYLLVAVIGTKLVLDWAFNRDPRHPALDFHHADSPTFWVFWGLMAVCFCVGFIRRRAGSASCPGGQAGKAG